VLSYVLRPIPSLEYIRPTSLLIWPTANVSTGTGIVYIGIQDKPILSMCNTVNTSILSICPLRKCKGNKRRKPMDVLEGFQIDQA